MRLIHTSTFRIEPFDDDKTPPYAILSHTWTTVSPEITFADMQDLRRAKKHVGWQKVADFCEVARQHGYEYGWDDTCCIDKSSSSELSEALNSMYAWYTSAAVCFAYLSDVKDFADPADPTDDPKSGSFRSSRWFRRGWTLQELIAPRTVIFFSRRWVAIGTKHSLAPLLEDITRVERGVLEHTRFLSEVSIARRMSWAATRQTGRLEDRAYSLMGLFGVNMPTIYGEGDKAFIRLQLEIIQQSPDHSIFAWGRGMLKLADLEHQLRGPFHQGPKWLLEFRSLLASSPSDFEHSSDVRMLPLEEFSRHIPSVSVDVPEYHRTNFGILLHLPLYNTGCQDVSLAALACEDGNGHIIALLVQPKNVSNPKQYYVGMHSYGINNTTGKWHPYFRRVSIPVPSHGSISPADSTPERKVVHFWQHVSVQTMYIHSHNADPQRSTREGMEGNQLRLHTSQPPAPVRQGRVSFEIPAYVLSRLQGAGFRLCGWGEDAKDDEIPGWTPMRLWRKTQKGLEIVFDAPTLTDAPMPTKEAHGQGQDPPRRHGAFLIRGPARNAGAVAVIIGATVKGTVWAEAIVLGPEHASRADGDLVRFLSREAPSRVRPEELDIGGKDWKDGRRIFHSSTGPDGARLKARLTFAPWFEGSRMKEGRTMKWTIRVELDFGAGARVWAGSEEEIRELADVSHKGSPTVRPKGK